VSEVARFLAEERDGGEFPSAVALVADEEKIRVLASEGCETGTLFDVASLTKVLVTAPLSALAEREGLVWDRPVGFYLPEFKATKFEDLLVWHLAAHVSGLPAWRPLYAEGFGPSAYSLALGRLEPEARPGEKVIYSDMGILVFGEILESVFGEAIDLLFAREVAAPLSLRARFGPIDPAEGVAPTETGNRYEASLCAALGINFGGFRTELICGQVHDANAYYRGGVAPHAGLFATAEDVWKLARGWLSDSRRFARDRTPDLPEGRGLFWQLKRGAGSAIAGFSDRAFGHTGFTGTSLWIDPDCDAILVLLTNRVHPEVRNQDFNAVRRRFHETAIRSFE
jgi:CubicO group peptidase (beta-lactamase class C family)